MFCAEKRVPHDVFRSAPDWPRKQIAIREEPALNETSSFYLLCAAAILLLLALVAHLLSRTRHRKKTIAEDAPAHHDSPTGFTTPDDLSPPHPSEPREETHAGAAPRAEPKKNRETPPDRELEELLIWRPPALQLACCPHCGTEQPAGSREPCEVCGRKPG